jgi:serine/threonine-protein kinase RsbW
MIAPHGADAKTETVQLIIPCRPEYVGVARLAVLGIASRMPFSYDEVEDVRLAVGEACTHAVERAGAKPATIRIISTLDAHALTIEVKDDVAEVDAAAPSEEARLLEEAGVDQEGLGALLMEILVDEVKIETTPAGTSVLLTKYAPA